MKLLLLNNKIFGHLFAMLLLITRSALIFYRIFGRNFNIARLLRKFNVQKFINVLINTTIV